MKIIIFSPIVKISSIAGVVKLIYDALILQGHEVIIVRTEEEKFFKSESHEYPKVFSWNDARSIKDAIQDSDALVYHVGNNFLFHSGSLGWMENFPGIICLHDYFLGNLFKGWAINNSEKANKILQVYYGESVVQEYFNHSNAVFIENTIDMAPLVEWICSMGYGVIAHSSWGIQRVLSSCPGPVRIVSMCHNKEINVEAKLDTAHQFDPTIFHVLTIGHINYNKRAKSVILAIAQSPVLKKCTKYHLVGKVESENMVDLLGLANQLSVSLNIAGEVDNQTLEHAISQADVISCLRWPVLESASGSLIEALLNGKPTIVTNTGFYNELPDECVYKIDPADEVNSLQKALELLFNEPELRKTMGKAAQEWAHKTFTAANYAQQLLEMAVMVNKTKPMIDATDYFKKMLSRWGATKQLYNLKETIDPLRFFE